mgnify:CR=1 FL=1
MNLTFQSRQHILYDESLSFKVSKFIYYFVHQSEVRFFQIGSIVNSIYILYISSSLQQSTLLSILELTRVLRLLLELPIVVLIRYLCFYKFLGWLLMLNTGIKLWWRARKNLRVLFVYLFIWQFIETFFLFLLR